MKRKITKQSHKPRHIRCELCESTQKLPILNEQNSSRDSNIGLTCSVFAIKIDLCLRINWRKKTPKPLIVKHQANSICKYISIGLFSRWFGSKSKKVKPIWILRRTDWARKIWIRKVLFEIISKSISLIFDKRERERSANGMFSFKMRLNCELSSWSMVELTHKLPFL